MKGETVSSGHGVNEYGVAVSIKVCTACHQRFSVCPADVNGKFGTECLAVNCPSYDLRRDFDLLWDTLPIRRDEV